MKAPALMLISSERHTCHLPSLLWMMTAVNMHQGFQQPQGAGVHRVQGDGENGAAGDEGYGMKSGCWTIAIHINSGTTRELLPEEVPL